MKLFQSTKEEPGDYYPEPKKEVRTMKPMKWFVITVGGIVGVVHIGILGHLLKPQPEVHQPPAFNIPHTPYSSYKIKAGKDGYTIEYRANDPKVLESSRTHAPINIRKVSLEVVQKFVARLVTINIQWKAPVIWVQEVRIGR